MTSAAEDLALDFLDDEEFDEQDEQPEDQQNDEDEMRDEEAEASEEQKKVHATPSQLDQVDLDAVLNEISNHVVSSNNDAEAELLTKANQYSTVVDNEMAAIHTTIRNFYSIRFPELETMIQNPLQYAKAVAAIGNGPMDKLRENTELKPIMNGSLLMGVAITATQTTGREMSSSELQRVKDACDRAFYLDRAKKILIEYVETCMDRFAPNLTAIVGSNIAAQLIQAAGGIPQLANRPHCNLPALGVTKSLQAGMATNVNFRQQGYLYDTDLVREVPPDLRRQALRIISGKVTLAARVDASGESRDGSIGERFREEVEKRMDKLKEPPPNNGPKALPAPDDKLSRKRGGRRARKAKEATATTELSKARNRMAFGKEEAEIGYGAGDGSVGLGMIGQSNEGKIRAMQIDQRTKAKLGKKNPGWGTATPAGGAASGMASSLRGFGQGAGMGNASVLRAHGLKSGGYGAGTAGTASSIAFTPVQGLELVDPKAQAELKRKREAEDDKYFKSGAFTQVGNAGSAAQKGKMDGDFKVPGLPARAANGSMAPPPAKKQA